MNTTSRKERLTISNDTKFLEIVRSFIHRMVSESQLDNSELNKIILAADEAVTNIIEHAYEMQRTGTIDIEAGYDDREFRIVITDSGKSFNPASINNPDMLEHIKARKKRGLGIFLMRQIMDEVSYSFKEGLKNELVLIKYITNK